MKLSIITINYNNKIGLEKTIASVLSQTWRDFEWILIDGGSIDGSKDLIEELAKNPDSNVNYWCSEKDNGVYNAMNKGIAKARGEYLNFMNSGDCFFSNKTLSTVFDSNYDADIIYGNCNFMTSNQAHFVCYPRKLSLGYLFKETICHQSSFIKTTLLKESGYREDLKIVSDWERYLNWYAQGYKFVYIDKVLSAYDVTGLSSNTKLLKKEKDQIVSSFVSENALLCASELSKLQETISSIDCYEVREIIKLKQRGHTRQILLHIFLQFVKFVGLL